MPSSAGGIEDKIAQAARLLFYCANSLKITIILW